MIVYRCVNESEIANMLGISCYRNTPHCKNTFKYQQGVDYKHFFYYYDSAIAFKNFINSDRYYDKYTVIMAYEIDDNLLKKYLGVGEYELDKYKKEAKSEVLQHFKKINYPEFALPSDKINNDMLVGIGDEKRITPVRSMYFDHINNAIEANKQSYLAYQNWLFSNGTDIEMEKVIGNMESLFPIGDSDIPTIQLTKK